MLDPQPYIIRDGGLWNNLWNAENPVQARPTPLLTVRAPCDEDVTQALNFAQARGLKVTARGTGHHCAALSLKEGALLIDLSQLTNIRVDEDNLTAWIQPGVRSGQLYKHLSELPRRLLFPGGHISTVGVGGFTAGGGVGWNNREHGFACDNVIEFRVAVPATDMEPSKVLVCSLEQNQDLFWACRGAARFVGIILEMKVRLYPAPDTIRSLFASVPLNSAHAAWALWKSAVDDTPTSCYPMIVFSTTPDGQKSAVIAMYNFAAEESDRTTVNTAMDALVEGLSALDGCTIMLDGNLPFVEALASQDAFGDVPNQAVYNGSAFVALDKANTQFVDVLLKHFSEVSHARTGIVLAPTCPSPPTDTGVFGDRSNLLWYEILTGWERTEGGPDADGDLQHISWTDGLFSELRTGGFMEVNYMNNSMLLGRDESTAGGVRPRHCFTAEAFERLKSVKAKYDPNGMLAPLDG